MPEFKINVYDLDSGFKVVVLAGKEKFEFGWHGGDFVYEGREYTLRGPYHGLNVYVVFELKPVAVKQSVITKK